MTSTSWFALSATEFERHKVVEGAWYALSDTATYLLQLHKQHFTDLDGLFRGNTVLLFPHQLPTAHKIGTLVDGDTFDWAIDPRALEAVLGDDGLLLRDDDPWHGPTPKEEFLKLVKERTWTHFGETITVNFHDDL